MGPHEALALAIKAANGQARLAEIIGVPQSNISFWLNQSRLGVRAEYVLPIEAATGIERHHLRPDLYPAAASQTAVISERSSSSTETSASDGAAA